MSNIVTFAEIETAARQEKSLEAPPPHVQLTWWVMRYLYRRFRAKEISREAAKREKAEVERLWEETNESYIRRRAAWSQYQENIRAASEAWNSLPVFARTASDAELIDRLLVIISAMVDETVTARAVGKARIQKAKEANP